MSDEDLKVPAGPPVVLNRIARINTYEVLESDLDALDALVSRETQALGFATAAAGTGITTFTTLFTSELSPHGTAVYTSISGIALITMIWFTLSFIRVRKARPRLLEKIRHPKASG